MSSGMSGRQNSDSSKCQYVNMLQGYASQSLYHASRHNDSLHHVITFPSVADLLMISVSNLTKHFGRFRAVDRLSFQVASQEAIALWGPNGAGKTTVIKCLLGLLRYQGTITVDGCDARKLGKAARRRLGYVPQEPSFYAHMGTLELLLFYGRLKKLPAEQATAALDRVGLQDHASKAVGALSGGMKQRLALGLALLADPPVLVLDEPTANLDTAARDQFLHLLARFKADGKTVLFTSHRLEEIEALADRVLVLDQGRLQLVCSGRDLAGRLGLHSFVKLRLQPDAVEASLAVLRTEGFFATRNGTGVLVEVSPTEKAAPIETLVRRGITVIDFDVE